MAPLPSYRRAWISVGVAFAIAAALWEWSIHHRPAEPTAVRPDAAFPWERANPGSAAAPLTAASRVADGAPTHALLGAASLRVDPAGQLIPSRALRDWFDALLRGHTLQPSDIRAARERLLQAASALAPAKTTEQLGALFDRYVGYQLAVLDLGRSRSAATDASLDLRERLDLLDRIAQLQAHTFSAVETQAFFGDELAGQRYALQRELIWRDPNLSPLEQARTLDQLRAALPASLKTRIQEADSLLDLDLLTTQWRGRQGSADELHAIREVLTGPQATAALEAQERRSEPVQRLLQDLGQRIQAVSSDPSLSDLQRQAALEQLRQDARRALQPLIQPSTNALR